MNDDEKKTVSHEESDASADVTGHDDTKITIKVDEAASGESGEDIDREAEAVTSDEDTVEADQDEMSEFDRELGRVEGIESGVIRAEEPVVESTDKDDASDEALKKRASLDADKPVDLDPVTPDKKQENALLVAMRSQERAQGDKKSRRSIAAVVFGVMALVFFGAAAYLYVQNADMADKKAIAESELAAAKSESVQLKLQQAQLKAAADKQAQAATAQPNEDYRVIEELDVRFKVTPETDGLIYGYVVTVADETADTVGFSTIPLARLAQRSGASAAYPCGLSGSVPTITRYAKDAAVGTSMASKVGKKIGEAYYVYTAPVTVCATTNTAEITARDTAAKAVYDSLEAVPAAP